MIRSSTLPLTKEALPEQLLIEEVDRQCDCACLEPGRLVPLSEYPVFCYVELTPACNNRCLACGNVFAKDRTSLPLSSKEWEVILTKLRPHIHRLKLTGGEPTLHPEFDAIIRIIQKLDIPFALFTNARWDTAERLCALLRNVPQCKGLLVSLHGATTASHDTFTNVPGSFYETYGNIKQAIAAGLSVTTSTVITRHNWYEVDAIVALSRESGAHYAVFNRYLGPPLLEIEPSKEQLQHAVQVVDYFSQWPTNSQQSIVKFGNCIPQCFYPSSSTGCSAGIAYCTIDPWGRMRPCNHSPLIVGDLLSDSLEECWHSAEMQCWRALVPEQCQSCAEFARCHGGCRAIAQQRGLERDPLIQYHA
jgi:radical SAM protein with 4Fe4S-binding SPASM domain